jgi:3-deoxy-7-phosphoheptulonate synthase
VNAVGKVVSYRGDNVNGFDPSDRDPDPTRLLLGYFHSSSTLNYLRSLLDSGFSDLHRARAWELGFVKDEDQRAHYESMAREILSSLDFMRVVSGGALESSESVRRAAIYVSHEGLHLPYEEAMTREADSKASIWDGARGGREASSSWYNLGAHFIWIGDRTRALEGAHIEYFRGIENPVGIKVGPSTDPKELVELIRRLWPDPAAKPGKIVLITRLGAERTREALPPIVRAVTDAGMPVVWTCDPMHGNTRKSDTAGLKTREFGDIVSELRDTFEVHRELGTRLGGVHFEMTGEDVTECTGGSGRLSEKDLPLRYTTHCDPRLNYGQSLELAFLIAKYLRRAAHVDEGHEKPGSLKSVWSISSLETPTDA